MSLSPFHQVPPPMRPLFWLGALVIVCASGLGFWLSLPMLPAVVGALLLLLMFLKGSTASQNTLNTHIEQREQEIQSLQQVQANKKELLATISHELRTPLNVVMGLHPSIQEGVQHDTQAQALLDQMQVATADLLQAFQSILSTSQPHAKGLNLTEELTKAQQDVLQSITQRAWQFLLVDDSPLNLMVLRLMLEKRFVNAHVACVSDAYAAMQYLTNTPVPHMMLLDVLMPDMDGYDLARWVRNHARAELAQLPIVAITGTTRPEDATLRSSCGINEVVYKPLDEQLLCVRVSQVLQEADCRGIA